MSRHGNPFAVYGLRRDIYLENFKLQELVGFARGKMPAQQFIAESKRLLADGSIKPRPGELGREYKAIFLSPVKYCKRVYCGVPFPRDEQWKYGWYLLPGMKWME